MVTSGIVVNEITSSIVAENSGCNFEFNDVLNFLLTLALQAILNWSKKFLAAPSDIMTFTLAIQKKYGDPALAFYFHQV
jgi:hypothetical protein